MNADQNKYEYLEADRFGIQPQHGWEQDRKAYGVGHQ